MCAIPDFSGSDGGGQTSGENRDFAKAFTRKDYYQELIDRANTVSLVYIFKYYGLQIDEQSRKMTCPFLFHKGGRESTPSFYYNPLTNSFRCYGCGTGHTHAHGCEFIAALEDISRVKAAYKILEIFSNDINDDAISPHQDFSQRLEIMMEFTNLVREFRQFYLDKKSQDFIEKICWVYDHHNMKYNHSNDALRRIVDQIKIKIQHYLMSNSLL